MGYLYGASALYTVPTLTVIALQTATFIFAASIGVAATVPEHGFARLLSGDRPSAILMRRLLPLLVALPIVVGMLRLAGERAGLYDTAFGSALRTVSEIVLFLLLLWWTGASIDRHSAERERAERERERLLVLEREARADAEREATAKEEFLATLSHELRTPLNAILGWTHILLEQDLGDPDRVRRALEIIRRNGRAQAQLVSDMLDMSRIVSGKMRLDVQRVDLAAVVDAAIETVRPAADAKGVRIERAMEPLGEPIHGDPARLQQVAWNLLSNAVKFTPRGGRVHVALTRRASQVELAIRDTGEGIAPEFLPHLYQRFRQADGTASRPHGGLGLGLALVKQLVELHGGTVRAASEGPGAGATFVVALPVSIARLRDEREDGHPRAIAGRSTPVPLPELNGTRVLVVDDETDALEMVRRVLEERGAHVVTAAGVDEALAILQELRFDVLVSDIAMPRRDGYDLVRECRLQGIATPAIALTAFARTEDRTLAMLAGFHSHVAKPVDPAELVATIASLARSAVDVAGGSSNPG